MGSHKADNTDKQLSRPDLALRDYMGLSYERVRARERLHFRR